MKYQIKLYNSITGGDEDGPVYEACSPEAAERMWYCDPDWNAYIFPIQAVPYPEEESMELSIDELNRKIFSMGWGIEMFSTFPARGAYAPGRVVMCHRSAESPRPEWVVWTQNAMDGGCNNGGYIESRDEAIKKFHERVARWCV